jgi:enterochelin esterase family protein
MRRIAGTNLWFHTGQLRVGTSHRFHYLVNGAKFGGSVDVPAYTPDSYARPGVPQGRLSEKLVHASKLYGGMETNYWIYVPAQYNPAVPAALMVWQDGERYITRNVEESCRLCPSLYRLQEVTDNLIHDKKIPVMIHVFVSPGTLNGKPLRSILYDTVSDKYGQFLIEELLPEVSARYNIRKDAYSRAIQGQSSGGIAAFTVAFNRPEAFSRVYTVVGSFTALQWKPGELDGGNIYPFKVRREPKRNLRVWMNDGSEDQEALSGSWPLQNIQLANSLKLKGYDFYFSFGGGSHHAALAASELPACLTWLWRDYDPATTEQTYEQTAEEQSKPPFRVRIYNR